LSNPVYARLAARRILSDLSYRFDGDEGAILVAYNAGPGRAEEWLASGKDPSVLPEETRKYLARAGVLDEQGAPDDDDDAALMAAEDDDDDAPLFPDDDEADEAA
jgi:hypothetical protein